MKIDVDIVCIDGRYNVQVSTPKFTALEEQKMQEFGQPLIEIGGDFTGTVSRPGQTNTTATVSGGGGSGATLTVDIENGAVVDLDIAAGGTGYTVVPTIIISGDGIGASATCTISGGAVVTVTVNDEGSGYHVVPITVEFTLPTATRRMESDFPVKQVFDLADTPNADVMAKVWADAIVTRLTSAKNTLIAMTTPLEGETGITV
jgi:hypothetical protein